MIVPHNYAKVELICRQCGKAYLVPPCKVERSHYCSHKCLSDSKKKPLDFLITGLKICHSCGKELPLERFGKHPGCPGGYYTYCRECQKEKSKNYIHKDGTTSKKWRRDRMRKMRLRSSNGKTFFGELNKREYPTDDSCEICHEKKRLAYHHWDDNDLSKGMWICVLCHTAVHWMDRHSVDEYYSLKKRIMDSEVPIMKKLRI